MIITEHISMDGEEYIYTYSNSGHYIVRDGALYEEAYDPAEFNRTYTEGDPLPLEEPSEEKIDNNVWAPDVYG